MAMRSRTYKWIIGFLAASNTFTLFWLWPESPTVPASNAHPLVKAEVEESPVPASILPRRSTRIQDNGSGFDLPKVRKEVLQRISFESLTLDQATGHLCLSEEFEWLAAVTPQERQLANASFRRFGSHYRALEARHIEAIAESPESLEIHISPFGELVEPLENEFLEELSGILGEERFRLLRAKVGSTFALHYGNFASDRRSIVVGRTADSPGYDVSITTDIVRHYPSEDGSIGMHQERAEWSVRSETIPRHLLHLLPQRWEERRH